MNERVKLIRKQLGMTQEQLAQRLGIGKAALSMIETGKAGLGPQPQHTGSGIERESRLARNRQGQHVQRRTRPDGLHAPHGQFAAVAERAALFDRGHGGLVPLFSDRTQTKPVNFHPHPQPPEMRRGDLHRRGFDVPAAEERRHRALQAAARHRRHLLGRHIPVVDRHRRRGVRDGEIFRNPTARGYVKLVSQNVHHADKDVEIRASAPSRSSRRVSG